MRVSGGKSVQKKKDQNTIKYRVSLAEIRVPESLGGGKNV